MTHEIASHDYTKLLELVADGVTVTEACQRLNIARANFYRDCKRIPDLNEAFRLAQEIGCEAQADTLLTINTKVRDALMAKVVSENLRWLLSKRSTAKFGDAVGAKDNTNNDLTSILKEAIARIPRPDRDPAPMLDAESVTISDILGD
jgi:hypothetical protein